MPLSKKKEKVDVTRGKGIELLSQVALTKDAQFEEVRKKSMRDFYKTHPSGSGNDKDDSNNEQVSSDEDSDQEDNDDDKTQSDNEHELDSEHETDKNESGSKFDHDESEENKEDDEDETNIIDNSKGDKDKEMDYTTSQLYDDVDIGLNEPVDTNEGFVQEEGTDATMTNVQHGNENPEILQVIEDAHVTLSTVPQKTEVPVTSSSHSSDLVTKFLNFLDIPHTYAEIVSLLDVHVYHEESSQPQSSYEAVATLIEFELKKILIDKMGQCESYLAAPDHKECYDGLEKSYDLDKTIFSIYGKVYSLNSRKFPEEDQRHQARNYQTRHQEKGLTPYQVPQGFTYVDTLGRNRLMRLDELYKFSDGTLTRLRTLLKDITKNIHMEYLPKRRWSTLEKKRANIMIKAIDKQSKERRMMRSLENFSRKGGEGRARLKKEGVDKRLSEMIDISFALPIDVQVILSRQRWMIGNSKSRKGGEGRARLKKEGVDKRLSEMIDISFALPIDVQVILSRQRWMIGNSKKNKGRLNDVVTQ
nr:hypothetical protein [Tanacetum cinerariifolium]